MAFYFIDYENLNKKGLESVESLTAKDSVFIFYSSNANTLTFELHEKLMKAKCKVEYIKVETGSKNALDFQLTSLLGYMIAVNGKKETYCIVSNDTGYNCLKGFWENLGASVNIVSDLLGNLQKDKEEELKEKVAPVLKGFDGIDPDKVIKFIMQYKTKQGLNNALMKEYKDSKKIGEVYNAIKPFIADKKGN